METTKPTSGSCRGSRQLPAPNDGASRFHTRTVRMTISGLQIQQSSGSGRVDLAARRCANYRETSLLVRSSRIGTPFKVGEKERGNGVFFQRHRGPIFIGEKGVPTPLAPPCGTKPHMGGWCGCTKGGAGCPSGPHVAH